MSTRGSYAVSVLVVDDDTIFHFLMKKMLLRLGVMPDFIQTACSGKEALDKLVEFQHLNIPLPDIILLDLNMPMMGGFEFLEKCRKQLAADFGKAKVVIVSSSLDPRDSDHAMSLGADNYLIKPVSENDLKNVIDQH